MGWKASSVMHERTRFIEDWLSDEWTVSSLAQAYGVSRKTAYKWIGRFKAGGIANLGDASRAARHHPNAVAPVVVERIVDFKRRHSRLGPLKVRARLAQLAPATPWPAASTIGDILARHGLVQHRKVRRNATPSAQPFATGGAPNEVWCADFKGWFVTGDQRRCTPLTITDHYSRYLLCCQGLTGRTGFVEVKPLFEVAFRTWGLPQVIHTDNGTPFASVGLAGLSKLSVWWLKLGIWPQRSRAGHPQDNGRHERMHRTLKQYTAAPPAPTAAKQQRAFEDFVKEYNDERPHQALGQTTPSTHYHGSPRPYPERVVSRPDYPDDWAVRKVKNSGRIKWRGNAIAVTDALTGEYVGLKPVDNGLWAIYYLDYPVGLFDEKKRRVRPFKKRTSCPSRGDNNEEKIGS